MKWLGLTQDVERLSSTCPVFEIINKERGCKKYGLLPPKVADSDPCPDFSQYDRSSHRMV
jgi:hypothetical protein